MVPVVILIALALGACAGSNRDRKWWRDELIVYGILEAVEEPSHDDDLAGSIAEHQYFVAPKIKTGSKVSYPLIAKLAHLEGKVKVRAVVSPVGQVISASIDVSVHPLLDRAAMSAVYKTKFEPGRENQEPIESVAVVGYDFRIPPDCDRSKK